MNIYKLLLSILKKYKFNKIDKLKIIQLSDYISLILKYNSITKLTSDFNVNRLIERHIIDSLQLLKIDFVSQCETILDIGSGAGFPGIPLYIFTNKKLLLIESKNKKAIFLSIVKNHLKLKNINIINKRAEDLAHNPEYREKFDLVVSRALSNFNISMELSFPFCNINGNVIYYATKNTLKILEKEFNKIIQYGCKEYNIFEYKINNIKYYIFHVKKLWKTPEAYPRNYKQINKNRT